MAATYVQSIMPQYATISNGSTFALGSNVTAGNALIVVIQQWYNGCPPSLTDSQGNTWTRTSPASTHFVYTAVAGSSGANTVTLSAGCSTNAGGLAYFEVSGLQTNPFDQFGAQNYTSSPGYTVSITPTTNGQFLIALFRGGNSNNFTPVSPFTLGTKFPTGGGNEDGGSEYYTQTTAAAIAASATASGISGSYPFVNSIWSFKATTTAAALTINVSDTTTMSESINANKILNITNNTLVWGLRILG